MMIKIVIMYVVQHELTQSAREGMKKGRDFRLKTHLYDTTATTEGQDEKRIEYWYRSPVLPKFKGVCVSHKAQNRVI